MLSEAKIVECLQSADCTGVVRMSFESGPYCVDRPTIKADNFARAIESAACAERDARIAELERELEEARKDAERYRALKARHGYLMVVRLVGDSGYSSATKDAVIDAYADAAIKEINSVDGDSLQRLFDAARKGKA